jgi:hypothetical protein
VYSGNLSTGPARIVAAGENAELKRIDYVLKVTGYDLPSAAGAFRSSSRKDLRDLERALVEV